jgi:uncharacterized protein YxeA
MKKIYVMLLVVLVAAGCNKEKVYKDNLNGEWTLYKYLLYNTDKTSVFQSRFPNYAITFSDAGTFSEFYTNPDSVNITGTYYLRITSKKLYSKINTSIYRTALPKHGKENTPSLILQKPMCSCATTLRNFT